MTRKKKDAIMDVLEEALRRETAAFNYYHKASMIAPLQETKSLLIQLAEEERKHRIFINREMQNIEKYLADKPMETSPGEDEINYFIPGELPFKKLQSVPGINLAVVSLPTEMLGGDNFDTIRIERENESSALGLFLFDVMGHGIEAMDLKAEAKKIFGKLREDWGEGKNVIAFAQPSQLMSTLNQLLLDRCQSSYLFVTAFYGILDPQNKTLTYSSAGHEFPIWIKSTGKVEDIGETDLLLGATKDVVYTNHCISVDSGDVIALFSDGITEAGDPDEGMFERHSVCQGILQSKEGSSQMIVESIFDHLKNFLKGGSLTDDCTLAVIKMVEYERKST